MKPKLGFTFLKYFVLIGLTLCFVEAKKPYSPEPEVFVGASPCNQAIRPMISIPADSECELVKWQLFLFKDPRNDTPSRFDLKYTYGMAKNGTQGFLNDGTSAEIQGKWLTQKNDGKLPGQSIIQLQPVQTKAISFARLDNNLLHLLDSEGKLMIGNAAWSYTLNRNKN